MANGWAIEYTDEFDAFWNDLTEDEQERVTAAVELLAERGPNLGRPTVGEVAGSRIHNLKEIRPRSTSIRILFAFNPLRTAILLLGADKAEHGWKAWYVQAVADAERLWDEHLDELRREGLLK